MKLQLLLADAAHSFPLCEGGLRGILPFKSLPTSLYKGRSENSEYLSLRAATGGAAIFFFVLLIADG